MTWIMRLAALTAVALMAPPEVSAEIVDGSVRGQKSATNSSAEDDYYWRVWNGALPERSGTMGNDDLLAVLTGKFTGPPIDCTFRYRGGALEPSTLAARSGTTVRIENRDTFTHELVVEGLPGFTPLESGTETVRAIPVPAGGPWKLADNYYPHVDGYLHSIRELVACAAVSKNGTFRFENVPPGPYSLRILRGNEQVAMQKITVPAGKAIQVDALTLENGGK